MSDLDRLFYWRGIAHEYHNYRGELTPVPLENRRALVRAMGVDVDDPDAVAEDVARWDLEPWRHWIKPLQVAPAGVHASFEIALPQNGAEQELHWYLCGESGEPLSEGRVEPEAYTATGEYHDGTTLFKRFRVPLGEVAANYYTLTVTDGKMPVSGVLALCPSKTFQPAWSQQGQRLWGVIVQLYTLRSERNWGIGDFTDLQELVELLAKRGAGVVGLNPLHALSPWLEDHFSPYSPSDRRFINPLYIDPHRVPDFHIQDKLEVDKHALASLRSQPRVDYVKVRELKYPVFENFFSRFLERQWNTCSERAVDFANYLNEHRTSLMPFSHFEATHQDWMGARYVLRYGERLEALDKGIVPGAPITPAQKSLLFHAYLQWVAELQLEECQQAALAAGMPLGLVRDLAVGADGGCAEVRGNDALFCRAASIGAPPDPFARTGQNWGFPPVIPTEMRASAFQHFRDLLRQNMQHCGALRIDHSMSLMRLWWCPPGQSADKGAYVYYPFHEMLNLLRLESELNQCAVIAEDLGVVPPEFRQALVESGIYTNKVFYFEKTLDQQFKPPEDYEHHAMAMVNNHDLPSLISWWNGSDLKLRDTLQLFEAGMDYQKMAAQREEEKGKLLSLLYHSGLYPESWHGKPLDTPADRALIYAILRLASRTASKIFVLQLEDLCMMEDAINVPGTFKEHPNWQRKIDRNTTDLLQDPIVKASLAQINQMRQSNGETGDR